MTDEPGGPDDGGPPDPLAQMAEGAITMHEIMTAYIAAGFTRSEAVYLVGVMLTANMEGPSQ